MRWRRLERLVTAGATLAVLPACGDVRRDPPGHAQTVPRLAPTCTPWATSGKCAPGSVLFRGRCSQPCATDAECGPGPEWSCDLAGGGACACVPAGPERCDGRDNDCSGVVDDGASCALPGERCEAGACVCPPDHDCGGQCSDLQLDPVNCGGCGKACPTFPHAIALCGAGACASMCEPGFGDCDGIGANGCETAGECQLETVFVIAKPDTGEGPLAISGGNVVWADSTRVWRAALSTGTQEVVVEAVVLGAFQTDESGVFWGDRPGRIEGLTPAGNHQVIYDDTMFTPLSVAVRNGTVAFIGWDELHSDWSPIVNSFLRQAGTAIPERRFSAQSLMGAAVALDAEYLYTLNEKGLERSRRDCDSAALVDSFPSEANAASRLHVDASGAYWFRFSDDAVRRLHHCQPSGLEVPFPDTGRTWDAAFDSSSAYALSQNGVLRIAKSGAGLAVLRAHANTFSGIAVDGDYVYLLDVGSGQGAPSAVLRRVHK